MITTMPTSDLSRSGAEVIQALEAAVALAKRAEHDFQEKATAAMRQVLKPGDVLDLRVRRGQPEYLSDVHTVRGNDRKTRLFRVAEAPTVLVNQNTLSMSVWYCEAVPVNETTGKDMNGSSHGADGARRTTVQLRGCLVNPLIDVARDDQGPLEMERLSAFLDRPLG